MSSWSLVSPISVTTPLYWPSPPYSSDTLESPVPPTPSPPPSPSFLCLREEEKTKDGALSHEEQRGCWSCNDSLPCSDPSHQVRLPEVVCRACHPRGICASCAEDGSADSSSDTGTEYEQETPYELNLFRISGSFESLALPGHRNAQPEHSAAFYKRRLAVMCLTSARHESKAKDLKSEVHVHLPYYIRVYCIAHVSYYTQLSGERDSNRELRAIIAAQRGELKSMKNKLATMTPKKPVLRRSKRVKRYCLCFILSRRSTPLHFGIIRYQC